MDKLPEYLRETVDWFIGKTRKRDRESSNDVEQKLYLQEPLLERRVPEPDLIFLTDLPGGLDFNEWLASHTIGFFEHINLIYGTISEFCNSTTCPDMVGPGPRIYMWVDEKGKKSRLSAPQYIDYIMTYVQNTINDESIFPTKHGNDFPVSFENYVKKIHKLLFHVLSHIYYSHFKEIVLLQLHAHLNSVFAHLVEFNLRFHTVEDKELEVLEDLIIALKIVPPKINDSSSTTTGEENKENIEGNNYSHSNSGGIDEQMEENRPTSSSGGTTNDELKLSEGMTKNTTSDNVA